MSIIKACKEGDVETVKRLLDKANLEEMDELSWRPIHHACYLGHVEIVKLLLDRVNLEPPAYKDNKWIPIQFACRQKHVEIVKLLLSRTNPAKRKYSWNPVHLACNSDSLEIVKLLVDGFISDKIYGTLPKFDLNCVNNYNQTALDVATSSEVREFIKKKLEISRRTLFRGINKKYSDVLIRLKS